MIQENEIRMVNRWKKEIFYKADFEINENAKKILLEYGRSYIVNDEDKIIDYAINKLLKESVSYFKNFKKIKSKKGKLKHVN